MVEYVQLGRYANIQSWRTEFVHSAEGAIANRKNFWYDVVKATFTLLYADDGKLQNSWLGSVNEDPTLSNLVILDTLKGILKPSMVKFFTNETIKSFFNQSKRPAWNFKMRPPGLPFLFIIDEAAYLFHTN